MNTKRYFTKALTGTVTDTFGSCQRMHKEAHWPLGAFNGKLGAYMWSKYLMWNWLQWMSLGRTDDKTTLLRVIDWAKVAPDPCGYRASLGHYGYFFSYLRGYNWVEFNKWACPDLCLILLANSSNVFNGYTDTFWCRYNALNSHLNPRIRHHIARPSGRYMRYFFFGAIPGLRSALVASMFYASPCFTGVCYNGTPLYCSSLINRHVMLKRLMCDPYWRLAQLGIFVRVDYVRCNERWRCFSSMSAKYVRMYQNYCFIISSN